MRDCYKLRYVVGALLFLTMEAYLYVYIDKPLSIALRQFEAAYPAFVHVFRLSTNVGLGQWYILPSGAGAALCFFLYSFCKMSDSTRDKVRLSGLGLSFFFACLTLSGLLTDIIKYLIGRGRPLLLQKTDLYGFQPLSGESVWHSMPSGHSTTGFAIAFALSALFPRTRPWMLAFAVLIGLSRLMVNAHFLSDVVAGAAIGFAVSLALTNVFRRRGWLLQPQTQNSQ